MTQYILKGFTMNAIQNVISNIIDTVTNIPANISNAVNAKALDLTKAVSASTSQKIADRLTEQLAKTMENEGFDVTITVNMIIKNAN